MQAWEINIYGRVYQSGMRSFIKQSALQTGVKGQVKYTEDKSIFVLAEGNREALERFLDFCKLGYINSDVEEVLVKEVPSKNFKTFEILE